MNTNNGATEAEGGITGAQHVSLEVPPPLVIKYLQNLDKRLHEERQREICERFRNIRCFQHVLGTSTSFKLIYDKPIFSRERIIIEPQNWGSAPIKLWHSSVPKTLAMSLHNEKEPAFLTYVSYLNDVTVFCPETQDPIGRIVRREDNAGADIFCLATGKTFTMTKIESDTPASMRVVDSQGRVVAAAGVSKWKEITKYSKTTYLKQFALKVENGLSEPSRIIILVGFANWAMWENDKVVSRNRAKKCFGLVFAIVILLLMLLLHRFYGFNFR